MVMVSFMDSVQTRFFFPPPPLFPPINNGVVALLLSRVKWENGGRYVCHLAVEHVLYVKN